LFENYLLHSANEELATDADENRMDFDLFQEKLLQAKKKLPPRQAEIFELCKEKGISAPEVAQRLNISEQAVYNNLSRAMKFLRKELAPFLRFMTIFF
jgi:RNA polymerase sigma-70 factor (ECF subfamily)